MTLVVDRGSPPRRLPADRLAGKTVESTLGHHIGRSTLDRQGSDRGSDRVMELTKRCGPFPSAMFGFAIEGLR
jgi:hypothetical protein